jgi:hypothetical protein
MTSPWCGRRAAPSSCGTSADGRTLRGDGTRWRCTEAHGRTTSINWSCQTIPTRIEDSLESLDVADSQSRETKILGSRT